MFAIAHNLMDVRSALATLHSGIRNQAVGSAINKTLEQARTQMIRGITGEFNVKAGYVRDRLRIRRAVSRGQVSLEGSLIGGKKGAGRSANIIAFLERSVSLAEGRKRGKAGTKEQLFVQIKRGGPRKPLKGAFIGNKGRTVFERVGDGRLPIKPVQTIDVAQMFQTKRINSVVVKAIRDRFPVIFAREAAFYLDRFNKGGR